MRRVAALQGFAPNTFFGGAAGQLPGSQGFSAFCVIHLADNQSFIVDQNIWGNFDGASGWRIYLSASGVLEADVAVATPAVVTATYDLTAADFYLGKLLYVGITVVGGNLILFVQGRAVDTQALGAAVVPGVGAPRVGISQVPDLPFTEGSVLGVGYSNQALSPSVVASHFASCAQAGTLVDFSFPYVEPNLASGFSNLWRADGLVTGANPGDIQVTPAAVVAFPLPKQTWPDARDPSVFNATPQATPNAPLISLAATGFATQNPGVGLINLPATLSWM